MIWRIKRSIVACILVHILTFWQLFPCRSSESPENIGSEYWTSVMTHDLWYLQLVSYWLCISVGYVFVKEERSHWPCRRERSRLKHVSTQGLSPATLNRNRCCCGCVAVVAYLLLLLLPLMLLLLWPSPPPPPLRLLLLLLLLSRSCAGEPASYTTAASRRYSSLFMP